MAQENLGTDVNGKIDFSLDGPIVCDTIPLQENTVATVSTPPNFNRAFFSYSPGINVFVTLDGSTPSFPISITRNTQELNPSIRKINEESQSIKVISDTAGWVNIRYDLGSQQ